MARIRLKYVNGFANPQRKDGRVRYYFRRRNTKAIPLPGLPGSDAFMQAYATCLAAMPDTEVGSDRTQPGTIDALVVSYYRSDEWNALAADTTKTRRRCIERFRALHGGKRVALLRPDHIQQMLAAIEKPSAKRHWLKAIRPLLQSAVPSMIKEDPTKGIGSIKLPKTRGHHTWTRDEIAQYRAYWPLGTQQRLVFEFALETGSRRGEIVRLGPQHVRNGRIHIERLKGSKDVDIEMSDVLRAACDAMPKAHLTYVVTAQGRPRSKYGLGNDFAEWAKQAGLPKRCRLHGLKKSAMSAWAEAGFTAPELMARSGHRTMSEVQRYIDEADWKTLAASGEAKLRAAQRQNSDVTNIDAPLHKQAVNSLKKKG